MQYLRMHVKWIVAFAVLLFVALYVLVLAPPSSFPSESIISVSPGASLADVAQQFGDAHIIAHPKVLRVALSVTGAAGHIQAGAYLFKAPQNVLTVAFRLAVGAYGIPPVRITFPEGMSVREMAVRVHDAFPTISAEAFIAAGKSQEGYLFPDTYLFSPSSDAASIVNTMHDNFNLKIEPLLPKIQASGHSISDAVIMASIIEKEARTSEVRRMVAGILWKRLAVGMPLQVDAVFGYIYGRATYSPSTSELKIDSPYNTYLHTGLPPGPINNPGIDAIAAAIEPTKSDYFYYIVDKNGVIHYAKTYVEHQLNQEKYLH